jgi:hypothetical protein
MTENEINFVLHLAEESEKPDETLTAVPRFDDEELVGWNGESLQRPQKSSQLSQCDKRKTFSRRSDHERNNIRAQSSFLQAKVEGVKGKKLPSIPCKELPKFHFIQAPFQPNFSPKHFNLNAWHVSCESPSRYVKRSVHNEIIKKSDCFHEFFTFKPIHRNVEFALTKVKRIKLNKRLHSSLT